MSREADVINEAVALIELALVDIGAKGRTIVAASDMVDKLLDVRRALLAPLPA